MTAYTLNDLVKALQAGKIEKTAQAFSIFVRTRVREVGLSRRILPPVTLQPTMLDRDPNTQEPYWAIEVEPDIPPGSGAYVLSYNGEPQKIQLKGNFAPAYIYQLSTPRVEIEPKSSWTKGYSIQQWLEKNFVRELEKLETRKILSLVHEAAVDSNTKRAIVINGFSYETVLQEGIGLFDKNERSGPIGAIVLNALDYDEMIANLLAQGQAVDSFAKDIITNGMWGVTNLFGYNFVVTKQSSVVTPGVCYIIGKPEWFGGFGIVGDPQFYIENKGRKFTFEVWEDIATACVNGYSVAILVDSIKLSAADIGYTIGSDGKTITDLGDIADWSKYGDTGLYQ